MTAQPLAHDVGGRPLFPGTPVRFTDDVAHLYEDGTSGDWVVERLGDSHASVFPLADKASPDAKSRLAACRVLQIRDKTTGVWVFAPALWLATYTWRPVGVSAPERDDLFELARAMLDSNVGPKIKAWAQDVVGRASAGPGEQYPPSGNRPYDGIFRPEVAGLKAWERPDATMAQVRDSIIQEVGMMASARTPEMQAAFNAAMIREYGQVLCGACQCDPDPRGPSACADCRAIERQSVEASTWTNFLHDLSKMFNDGNVGCFASPESVRAAVEVTLSALKSAQKHRKEAEDRAGELEVKYEELKERVETARKAFGG